MSTGYMLETMPELILSAGALLLLLVAGWRGGAAPRGMGGVWGGQRGAGGHGRKMAHPAPRH